MNKVVNVLVFTGNAKNKRNVIITVKYDFIDAFSYSCSVTMMKFSNKMKSDTFSLKICNHFLICHIKKSFSFPKN